MDRGRQFLERRLKEEAERQKAKLQSVLDIVETQRRNLEDKKAVVCQLDEDFAKQEQQGEDVKRNVEKLVKNLNARIEVKKQSIVTAVENQRMKSLETLTKRKTEMEQQIKAIKSSLEKADKLLTINANANLDELKRSLEIIFEGINQTGQIDRDGEGLSLLVFVENRKMLDTVQTEELGCLKISQPTIASQSTAEGKGLVEASARSEAQFKLITRNAEGKLCYNNVDRVTVDMYSEQGGEGATEVRITDNEDGSYNISYFTKDQGRYKVSVKVNGRHICNSPFTVQVMQFQLKPVLSFGETGSSDGKFQRPWGVAVNEIDEIAVTDSFNNVVQIFNSDGNHVRSFGKEGDDAGEFKFPTGIAFQKNGNIFVADSNNDRIQIFSGEGKFLGQFGKRGSLDCQFNTPRGLSIDSDGNIIIADSNNRLIKIFSPNGEFLKKIGEQEFFPWHCIQFDKHLIVSDSAGHCIRVFDREGNFKHKFGKLGSGNGEFSHPRCLSVNKSGQLHVCDEGNHRIQIFEINGQFVGKFGTSGSKRGEFDRPRSVVVLNNGRVAVCDSVNNRIQLFEEQNVLEMQTE